MALLGYFLFYIDFYSIHVNQKGFYTFSIEYSAFIFKIKIIFVFNR